MIRKTFWSIVTIVLACSTGNAADIRRVVTGLDASNKAIALFDSRLTLNPGKSGVPAVNLWITNSSPPGFSFKDDSAQDGRCRNPASDQSRLDQSWHPALPSVVCAHGFYAAVTGGPKNDRDSDLGVEFCDAPVPVYGPSRRRSRRPMSRPNETAGAPCRTGRFRSLQRPTAGWNAHSKFSNLISAPS